MSIQPYLWHPKNFSRWNGGPAKLYRDAASTVSGKFDFSRTLDLERAFSEFSYFDGCIFYPRGVSPGWLNSDSLFSKFRKKSTERVDFSKYSIELISGKCSIHNRGSEGFSYRAVFSDTYFNFLLCSNGAIDANLGFEPHENSILISQIQGVSGHGDQLAPLKWPNLLLNAAVRWASLADIPEVLVLPHNRNKWDKVRDNLYGGPKLYYDVTPKREGFNYDSERRVYTLKTNGFKLLEDNLVYG